MNYSSCGRLQQVNDDRRPAVPRGATVDGTLEDRRAPGRVRKLDINHIIPTNGRQTLWSLAVPLQDGTKLLDRLLLSHPDAFSNQSPQKGQPTTLTDCPKATYSF